MEIKNWFISKNFNQQQRQAIENGYELEILKETEKAYQMKIVTDFGNIFSWIPKSVIVEDHFKANEMVKSTAFGIGTVIKCIDDFVQVKFENSIKTIMFTFLERV